MTTDELRSQLLAAPKNGYTRINETQRAEMEAYCKRYAAFMDACKTEREATAWTAKAAEDHGFKPFKAGMALNPGDKIYYVNRKKSFFFMASPSTMSRSTILPACEQMTRFVLPSASAITA